MKISATKTGAIYKKQKVRTFLQLRLLLETSRYCKYKKIKSLIQYQFASETQWWKTERLNFGENG